MSDESTTDAEVEEVREPVEVDFTLLRDYPESGYITFLPTFNFKSLIFSIQGLILHPKRDLYM